MLQISRIKRPATTEQNDFSNLLLLPIMSVTKAILERDSNGCCVKDKTSLLILLIGKTSMFDEEFSLEDQMQLKVELIHIVNSQTYFAKVILLDVMLGIFQEAERSLERPYVFLDVIRLLVDRVKYEIENHIIDILIPPEYFNFVIEHFNLISSNDDLETLASINTLSPASDATVTYDSDGNWTQEEY